MSIIISGYAARKNAAGESFIALILTGGLEMVKSVSSGKFYGTVRKCSIPSTVDEVTAKALLGTKMPGSILRVPCAVYEFTTSEGKIIELDFTYEYQQTSENLEEKIFN